MPVIVQFETDRAFREDRWTHQGSEFKRPAVSAASGGLRW